MADDRDDPIEAIYERTKAEGAERVYADWAERYDADNAALGFRLPVMAGAFAARHIALSAGPILDAGAGTGQIGSTLQVLGYDDITAIDISEAMLAIAARSGAYKDLKRQVLGERLDFPGEHFAGVLCIGCFGTGHAPPTTLRELVRVARPGGTIIFNVIENSWKELGFPAVIRELSDGGRWRLLEERGGWRPYTIGEPDLLTRLFVFRRS